MDLFETVREQKRLELQSLGLKKTIGRTTGRIYWELSTGAVLTEQEAFDWLEKQQTKNSADQE